MLTLIVSLSPTFVLTFDTQNECLQSRCVHHSTKALSTKTSDAKGVHVWLRMQCLCESEAETVTPWVEQSGERSSHGKGDGGNCSLCIRCVQTLRACKRCAYMRICVKSLGNVGAAKCITRDERLLRK